MGKSWQVGDDEAQAGEQLPRMPLDLRDHAAFTLPALRLIMEVLVEALDPGLRGPPHWPGQAVRDFLPQHGIGGQPDSVEIACFFKAFIDRGNGEGGIGAEKAHEMTPGISGEHRVQDFLPAICAMDVAVAQGAAFEHPELVEQKQRVVAGATEMTVPGSAFLLTMGGADRTVHVQKDVLQPVTVMKAVDPFAVQVGQRFPVLGKSQRLGLKPPRLRGGGRPQPDT